MKKFIYITSLIFILPFYSFSQLQVELANNTNLSPTVLVEDTLVTGCLQAYNVQYDGSPESLGYYSNGGGTLGSSSGIVISTGHAMNTLTGVFENDPTYESTNPGVVQNLLSIAQENAGTNSVHDVKTLEFDFIPASDTVQFKYIFASEEYPNFNCSVYNDAFAFFVSGPGIDGPFEDDAINIALVPGTNQAVCIANIHDATGGGGCPAAHPEFYVNNDNAFTNPLPAPDCEYNGFTTSLTATMVVQPCQVYHIKLCIGNGSDHALRSAVFIEAGSFTGGAPVTIEHNTAFDDLHNEIIEGCENYYVFTRVDTSNGGMSHPLEVVLNVAGNAILGEDISEMPDTFYIPEGEKRDTLFYSAYLDGIDEPTETVVISIVNGCPCGGSNEEPGDNGSTNSDTIYVVNNNFINAGITETNKMFCYGENTTTLLTTFHNIHPRLVEYEWLTGNDADTLSELTVIPRQEKTYSVRIGDKCSNDNDTIDHITFGIYPPLEITAHAIDTSVCPGDSSVIEFNISGGKGEAYICHETDLGMVENSFYAYPTLEKTIFHLIASDECPSPEVSTDVEILILSIPESKIKSDVIEGCQPLTILFDLDDQGDNNEYFWNFGEGNYSTLKSPDHTFDKEGNYGISLKSTSPGKCFSEDFYQITVYKKPVSRFFSNPEFISVIKPQVYFEDVSEVGIYSHWNFNFGKNNLENVNSSERNPMFQYPSVKENYKVELISETEHNCSDTVYMDVEVKEEYTFFTPNAFNPNSPHEKNRYFKPYFRGMSDKDYNMVIYNRWGEKVFETNSKEVSWDGKINGKDYAKIGVYPWKIIYTDEKGTKHRKTGEVTILK